MIGLRDLIEVYDLVILSVSTYTKLGRALLLSREVIDLNEFKWRQLLYQPSIIFRHTLSQSICFFCNGEKINVMTLNVCISVCLFFLLYQRLSVLCFDFRRMLWFDLKVLFTDSCYEIRDNSNHLSNQVIYSSEKIAVSTLLQLPFRFVFGAQDIESDNGKSHGQINYKATLPFHETLILPEILRILMC